MKTTRFFLWLALALTVAGRVWAYDPTKPLAHTDVIFFEPEKFTDVKDSAYGDSEKARNATLDTLRTYLTKHANQYLAAGQVLKITVTDVDLAGDFEPWHSPQFNDVRIVKDIYPPRIKLSFQLTDANGDVIKKGDRDLTDMAFLMKLSIDRDDPLRFEKELFDDWLRQEFRGLKKG